MGMREEQEEDDGHQPLLVSIPDEEDESLIRRTLLESKKIWQIAGPSIFSRLAMFSLTVITQSFAGHLSDRDLAAISIVTTVIISISFGFLLGMANALETLCGQAYGAEQYHMMGIYMQRSWVVLFLSSILMLPLFLFATPILKVTGQSTAVAELSGLVAMWLIPMHLSFAFQFTLIRFLQCQLKTAVFAWTSGVALALHVFVSWLFVYKLMVGIVGTALTLDFGGCQSWDCLGTLFVAGVLILGLVSLIKRLWGCGSSLNSLWLLGSCSRWKIFIIELLFCLLTLISSLFDGITFFGWESMIPLGFFAATGGRVANELGAGNAKGAKFATTVSVLTSLVVGIFFCSMIIALPDKLAMIFSSSISVIAMVDELAVLLASTILLNCIQPVLSGVAVGSGWQAMVAFINVGSYNFVGVPLGVVLGWLLPFGIKVCVLYASKYFLLL
ncbi:unnamed protein product [Ilex paraguariensis]|uniref:Multidrug and toxic compound extrusion protein n=1 Tax=Ilex paraguariensis TaxID=185542 RepID=A0ABC8RVL4_9AQUA